MQDYENISEYHLGQMLIHRMLELNKDTKVGENIINHFGSPIKDSKLISHQGHRLTYTIDGYYVSIYQDNPHLYIDETHAPTSKRLADEIGAQRLYRHGVLQRWKNFYENMDKDLR